MLEFLLTLSGGGHKTFPDSGPGPKTIAIGNENIGYFGKVTADQMLDRFELMTLLPIPSATVLAPAGNQVFEWLKFVFEGKYLFIPALPIYQTLSWNDVYNAGYMYPTNDNGLYPTTTPTQQRKLLTVFDAPDNRQYGYIVRSIKGAMNDPNGGTAVGQLGENEFDNLFTLLPGAGTSNWVSLNGLGLLNITQNTQSANTNTFAARQYNSGTGQALFTALSKAATNTWWRPVLELVPDGEVAFNPVNVAGISDIQSPPYAIKATLVDVAKPPLNIYGTQNDMKQPKLLSAAITP